MKLADVAKSLLSLRRWLGVPVIWKTLSMWHIHYGDFTEDLYHHCHPFCSKVKATCWEACCHQESDCLLVDAKREGKPFVKSCHAGVLELVVPAICQQHITGYIIAGPYRKPGQDTPIHTATKSYEELAEWEPEQIGGLSTTLELMAEGLASLRPLRMADEPVDLRIGKAIAYMQRNFDKPLRATTVATHCGMSESRFIHLFSKETGMPFSNYLINLRIEEAKCLLADPRLSKAEVALSTGFNDQSHFCSTFKRLTGLSPRLYQIAQNNKIERSGSRSVSSVPHSL